MKKIVILSVVIGISLPIFIIAKAPFGTCNTPIIKASQSNSKKSSNRYALLDMDADAEELSPTITEDQLASTIKRYFSRTFYIFDQSSPSFKTHTINPDNFESWVDLLSCIYTWLEKYKINFKDDITKLYTISDFIAVVARNINSKGLTDPQKASIRKQIEEKIKTVTQINSKAVQEIKKTAPKNWEKKVPVTSKLSDQMKYYTNFFNQYTQYKKQNKIATETDYFNQVLNKSVTNPKNLETDVNNLEEIIYRLENSFQWNIVQQLALTKFCKNFLQTILNRYGNGLYFTSAAFKNSWELSKELPSKIVLELSQLLFSGLNKLLHEL